ncbi:UbiA family prenyltransferase, partial [Photobacterium sanctipauli]
MAKLQLAAKGSIKPRSSAQSWVPAWQDYLTMTKPKVVAMLLLTALVGMCLAVPTVPSLEVVVLGLAGIGLQSAAAATFNHILDRRFDAKMARTYHRPLAKGRVETYKAV